MRAKASLVLVLLFGLLFTACGGAPAATIIARIPERTAQANTSRMALTQAISGNSPGLQMQMTVNGEGVMDFANQVGEITVNLGQLGAAAGGPSTVKTVFVKDTVYQQLPAPGGTRWVKIGPEQLRQMGVPTSSAQSGQSDARATLQMLRGVSDDVTEVAKEDVRGETTAHYRGTVNLDKAIEQSPPELRPQVEQSVRQLGTRQMPVDVWVDRQGRMRRLSYDMDLSNALTSQSGAPKGQAMPPGLGRMQITIELFDFGVPVNVTPPPENQVVPFEQFVRQQQQTPTKR